MEITKILKKHDQTERKANKRYQASRFAPVFKDDPSVFKDNEKLGIIDLASEIRNKICTFAGYDGEGDIIEARELVRPGTFPNASGWGT